MFSFLLKKSLGKRAALVGAVLVLLTSLLFISCPGGITPDNAQTPIINVQPQGNIWDVEIEDEFELTVEASVTDGGDLSYQWYSNTTASKSGGTVIYQEKSETLTLNNKDYTENGDYFFYVVVTNTKDGEKASVTSDVVVVTVDGVGGVYLNAQKPVIDTQPASTFWNVFTAASGVKLTVEAHVTDGGALSYQWYSNTSANAVNGTKIDTATDKDYTLTKTAYTANGTYYLYVTITNTNDDVTGIKNVHEASHVATVTVVGYPDTGYSDTHTMPSKLTGEWESEYGEIFTISVGEFSSGADWGDGWSGYKGTIVNHRGNAEGTAGYITIQYTQNDWDETAENKYYVIFYKDLTETTVTIAGAGSFTFTDPDFGASGGRATKDEAEATYTVSAGYFAMGSDLTRAEEGGVANAQTPSISAQPQTASWNVSAATYQLSVTAGVTDGGQLSYQWYSNTSATTTGGTEIGTDSATLSLAKADYPTNRKAYFYVVVTNTNNKATVTKTATATSNATTITVTGNTTTTYYPGDTQFNTIMASFEEGIWLSFDGYHIHKWSDFDNVHWDRAKDLFSTMTTTKSDLKTYSSQQKPGNNDYIIMYDEDAMDMAGIYGMSYMGIVRAVNVSDDNKDGAFIIEYFEGTDPGWLWDSDAYGYQGLTQGEKPFFGFYFQKKDDDNFYFGNTIVASANYEPPYYTETDTLSEAINKITIENQSLYLGAAIDSFGAWHRYDDCEDWMDFD
jgi:hypothetical protein